jgi:hypothetical protein
VIVISRRFRGPPESGHGGYTCGLLAREIDGPAAVTLKKPPPLERQLTLERGSDGRLLLRDGETVVAQAQPTSLELEPPAPVALEQAQAARSGYVGFRDHPFPHCFACGPDRDEGDGLRLFPGPIGGRDVIACAWRPDPALAGEDGAVRSEFVWAALDCPTAFACDLTSPPIVLARLTGRIDKPIHAGEQHVVTAWHIAQDGRKHHSACAISTPEGDLLALSQALWIELKDPSGFGVAKRSSDRQYT